MTKKQQGGLRDNQTGRPRIYEGDRTITMALAVPPRLAERLKSEAKQEGISRSKLVVKIVEEYFQKKKK